MLLLRPGHVRVETALLISFALAVLVLPVKRTQLRIGHMAWHRSLGFEIQLTSSEAVRLDDHQQVLTAREGSWALGPLYLCQAPIEHSLLAIATQLSTMQTRRHFNSRGYQHFGPESLTNTSSWQRLD